MQLEADMNNRLYLECGDTDETLKAAFMEALEQDGRNIARLQADCGLSHPRRKRAEFR